jgi:hypothetical protein
MSDEPSKKPGTRIESRWLDPLQPELSADLEKGRDPLYSDRRFVKSSASEASYVPPIYVPPMPSPKRRIDPGEGASAIGREAAQGARHARLPEQTVVIDEGSPLAEQEFDIDVFDDPIATEKAPRGPASDERATHRAWMVGKRPRSRMIWLVAAGVTLLACALLLTKGAFDSNTPPAIAPSSEVDAKDSKPSNVPAAPALAAATKTNRAAIPVGELPVDPMLPCPPAVPAGADARNGFVPARMLSPKGKASDVDPLFIDNPGY